MLSKIKNSKLFKCISIACITAMIAVFGAVAVSAEEASAPDMSSTLTSSFNSMKGDIFTYIGIALPIALGIVGAFFGIKAAVKFFKRTAGN